MVRREGSEGGVCERRGGENAGGGERVRWWAGLRFGGGPLGGAKMRERDSGGDVLDDDESGNETVGLVLACELACALAVGTV